MKRIITIILALCLLLPCAVAEDIDLSGLSYDQLVALKNRINLAMWNSQEWQEVTVPQGLWKVGEDIPAGTWTVHCAAAFTAVIEFGDKLDETGTGIDFKTRKGRDIICSPDYRHYDKGVDRVEYSFTVVDGDYICISNCDIIFTPYTGKPDLGFK